MKKPALILALAFSFPLLAHAASDPQKPHPRASRMSDCNKEAHAKGLKKDERRKFMSACLSTPHAAKASAPAAPAS
jgi:hypothetical protein